MTIHSLNDNGQRQVSLYVRVPLNLLDRLASVLHRARQAPDVTPDLQDVLALIEARAVEQADEAERLARWHVAYEAGRAEADAENLRTLEEVLAVHPERGKLKVYAHWGGFPRPLKGKQGAMLVAAHTKKEANNLMGLFRTSERQATRLTTQIAHQAIALRQPGAVWVEKGRSIRALANWESYLPSQMR